MAYRDGPGGAAAAAPGTSLTIQTAAGVTSALDSSGNRLAESASSGGFGWSLNDLHGDIIGSLTSSGAAIGDAVRYDPYGLDYGTGSASAWDAWRYRGRQVMSTPGRDKSPTRHRGDKRASLRLRPRGQHRCQRREPRWRSGHRGDRSLGGQVRRLQGHRRESRTWDGGRRRAGRQLG
jgi:hypothetical protein